MVTLNPVAIKHYEKKKGRSNHYHYPWFSFSRPIPVSIIMPKSSFLVLGSASTIFFILLTLSLFYAQSVDGSFDLVWSKKIVTVQNDIDPDIAFKIHCKSSENDLGEHTLYYKQNFYWTFKINLMRSTKFNCDSSWYDPNEKKNHIMEFFAYKTWRDYDRHCLGDCFWSIRRDGGYFGKSEEDKDFPFEKMFLTNDSNSRLEVDNQVKNIMMVF